MKKFSLFLFLIACFNFSYSQTQQSKTQEQLAREYYIKNIQNLDPIEGLWRLTSLKQEIYDRGKLVQSGDEGINYLFAIKKVDEKFRLINLSSTLGFSIFFEKSSKQGVYIMHKVYQKPFVAEGITNAILTDNSILEYKFKEPDEFVKELTKGKDALNAKTIGMVEISSFIKIYPTIEDYHASRESIENSVSKSGTGFALSSDGYIVTNNHIVENAKKIIIIGIQGNFDQEYDAKIKVTDPKNDIAILKIEDNSFRTLGLPQYSFDLNTIDVGNSVYVLGYPLRATMGDEIKLTSGIISSKSGYEGDVTSYQISAPVQPGNSGGPVFDSKGNIVGIVNAKYIGAENVTYAIKTSYLRNLIDLLESRPELPVGNLSGLDLPEKVKQIKKFVYVIKVD